jgi:hypothetical protein
MQIDELRRMTNAMLLERYGAVIERCELRVPQDPDTQAEAEANVLGAEISRRERIGRLTDEDWRQ